MIGREPVLGTYLFLSLSFLCFQHYMLCFSCAWWAIHAIRWSPRHRFRILLDYHIQSHSVFNLIVNVLSIFASSFHFGKMGIHQQTETTTILCYFHLRGYQLHVVDQHGHVILLTILVCCQGWISLHPSHRLYSLLQRQNCLLILTITRNNEVIQRDECCVRTATLPTVF